MSILSDTLAPLLAIMSHILDYFVTGNQLTERGSFIAGSLTDIVEGIAEFSTHFHVLLGNHV